MQTVARTPTTSRVHGTRFPSSLASATSLPPLIRRFPSEADPTESSVATLQQRSELPIEGVGAEVWYAVFLSAFLIGLLVLGGFWIWLNVQFL